MSSMLLAVMPKNDLVATATPESHTSTLTYQGRADALRYIALAGQPALRELASAARMSEAAFLAHLIGIPSQGAPGLMMHQ